MQVSLSGVREREPSHLLQIARQRRNVTLGPTLTARWDNLTAFVARVSLRPSPIQARSGLAILAVMGAAVLVAGWSVNSAQRPATDLDETAAVQSLPVEPVWQESATPVSSRPGQLAAARELAKLLTLSAYPLPGPDWSDVTKPAAPAGEAARSADPAAAKKGESKAAASAKQTAAVFSDRQLVSIRERLKLTPDQARYWPAVEEALRALTWHRSRGRPGMSDGTLDPNGVQGLIAAATPLVLTLREEQKSEVRTLAHLVGLEQLASQF
ncbi:MAG: hypothetical protein ACLPKB_13605 [Xanthobacteraceae bacterium]